MGAAHEFVGFQHGTEVSLTLMALWYGSALVQSPLAMEMSWNERVVCGVDSCHNIASFQHIIDYSFV